MKRLFLLFMLLILFPLSSIALVSFDYPSKIALHPGESTYTLYTGILYYLDLDRSKYSWSSPDDNINVREDGTFSSGYTGTYRIIGTPKESGLKRISFKVRYPNFVCSSDSVDITSPDGALHYFKLQQSGISGLDWKISGGVFKAEMACRENALGPNAVHLIPIKPGNGTLTYITNLGTRTTIDVTVHDSAFASPTPSPFSIPSESPETHKELESDLPHPSEYSGMTLNKLYEPFDYDKAKHSPSLYKNTGVYLSGSVLIYRFFEDGWGYAIISTENDAEKAVYITLPPGATGSGIDFGDDVEVYGAAGGTTEDGFYPVILTTMQIVNHGKHGLYPEIHHDLIFDKEKETEKDDEYSLGITTKSANLREHPNVESKIVFKVKQGERLRIIQTDYAKGWHKVSFRGQICFISSKLIDLK